MSFTLSWSPSRCFQTACFFTTNNPTPKDIEVYNHKEQRKAAHPHKWEAGTTGCLSFLLEKSLSAVFIYNHIYMIAFLNVMWKLEGEVDNVNFMLVDLNDFMLSTFISPPLYDFWTWLQCWPTWPELWPLAFQLHAAQHGHSAAVCLLALHPVGKIWTDVPSWEVWPHVDLCKSKETSHYLPSDSSATIKAFKIYFQSKTYLLCHLRPSTIKPFFFCWVGAELWSFNPPSKLNLLLPECNYLPTAQHKCNETCIFCSSSSLLQDMTGHMLNHSQHWAWKKPTGCGVLWTGLWLENTGSREGGGRKGRYQVAGNSTAYVLGNCEETKQLLWNIQVSLRKRLQDDSLHVVCSCVSSNANVQHQRLS